MTSRSSLFNAEDGGLENFESEANNSKCQLSKKQILAIAISAAVVVVLVIIIGAVVGSKSKKKKDDDDNNIGEPNITDIPQITEPGSPDAVYTPKYKVISNVPFFGEIISEQKRKRPVEGEHHEGLSQNFPQYGSNLNSVLGNDQQKVDLRNKLIEEACYLAAYGTQSANQGALTDEKYTWMNESGYLFQGTVHEPKESVQRYTTRTTRKMIKSDDHQRRLYKHKASIGHYYGNVEENEKGVIKKLIISPRGYNSYSVTGLYAPAGEVIKIEVSKADMDSLTNGITFHIGQALYNGQANNIWTQKNSMPRFPIVLNTMTINKNTSKLDSNTNTYIGYIGSFIGGPIYVRNLPIPITLTISGAVVYPHFILGVTTPEMFEESLKSSVPYFDLEVWNYGVLHSGPKRFVRSFEYDYIYNAATLWDKVALVTTYNNKQGVVFLYDPFVAAGAAVAFPGRSSVNCPASWMTSGLDYNSIVTVGTWGNFHEYHHNFQGYGVGNGGEVTNNGLNLVSYALFTKISSNRGIGNYGAQGLDHWTSYTSSVFALNEVLKIKYSDQSPNNGNQGLALYACLLHNFGPDAYIKVKGAGGGQGYLIYMNNWQKITHNNMYYYFNELLGGTGISDNADPKYPTFVPIGCIYQTGRSYLYYNEKTEKYEKRYFKSMMPFVIPYGMEFIVDLSKYTLEDNQYKSGSIHLPTNPDKTERFTYKIKHITQPQNGQIEKIDELHYRYKPGSDLDSGEIIVTLEIKDYKNLLTVDDIDLTIAFEQSHETLKTTLERTIYTYDQSNMYHSADDAYNNGFSGYNNKLDKIAHSNPTQNCNTDIWHLPDTEENHNKHPNGPDYYFLQDNMVEIVDGKLYFERNSKYRIYLRGRKNLAVYYSLDGKTYDLGATITETYTDSHQFKPDKPNTYFDAEYLENSTVIVTTYQGSEKTHTYQLSPDKNNDIRNWLYVKEVLIDQASERSYIGLGYKEWVIATFTMITTYFDVLGNELSSSDDPNIDVIWTNYSNNRGEIVAYRKTYANISKEAERYKPGKNGELVSINELEFTQLTEEKLTAPTTTPSYANAYRTTYQFPNNKQFTTDYFYTRTYGYSYRGDPEISKTWDERVKLVGTNFIAESDTYRIENLFREGFDNYIHPNADTVKGTYFAIDMGEEVSAISITFHGRTDRAANTAQQGFPKNFSLYISNDNAVYTKVGDFSNTDPNGNNVERSVTVNLGKKISFRYINITIDSSYSNTGRIILSCIKFTYNFALAANDNNVIVIGDKAICYGAWENKVAFSTFGSVFVGKAGSKIVFQFKGTRLGILSNTRFQSNYQVYIDGNIVNSIDVVKLTSEYGITYISEELNNGNHNVEVICTGEANFGCFTYYTDPFYN